MAFYYGLNSQNYSSLFTNSFSSSQSSNSNSLFNSLGDYAMIRSGGYMKLCKSYYAKETGKTSETDTKTDKTDKKDKADAGVAQDAVALKKSSSTLSKLDFTDKNKSKIAAGVKDYVKAYNELVTSAQKSDTTQVSNAAKFLTSYTKANETMLNRVGITIGSDNKLSVDSDVLQKASMTDVKSMFQGNSSFAGRTSAYATSIYTTAVANDSSLYSSSGSINTLNMSSLYSSYQ